MSVRGCSVRGEGVVRGRMGREEGNEGRRRGSGRGRGKVWPVDKAIMQFINDHVVTTGGPWYAHILHNSTVVRDTLSL